MLDSKILDRARRLIQTQFRQRRKILPHEISRILEEMNVVHSLHSGATLKKIHAICAQEVVIRTKIVWENIVRVHKAVGLPLTKTLAVDIKQEVNHFIGKIIEEIGKQMNSAMHFMERDAHRYNLDDARDSMIQEMDVEADLYVDSLAIEPKNLEFIDTKAKTIFISHAAEDAVLAEIVKTQIDNVFEKKVNVFVSSIPGTISPGSDWLGKIIGNLTENNAFIVLVSPYSEKRPFVWFEIGFSWLRRLNKNCEIYAICAPPIDPGNLPEPLCRLQATSLASEKQTKAFFDKLTKQFKLGNLDALEFAKIRDSLPTYPSQITQTENIDISDEAKELLIEASQSPDGRIMRLRTMQGLIIKTNTKGFVGERNARLEAIWEDALNQLIENSLIEDKGYKGEVFAVTRLGYEYADILQDKSSAGTSASIQQDDLEFEKASGTYISKEDSIRYCHKCLHSSSQRIPLKEQKIGWRCNVCDKFYPNPNYDRPTHTRNKRDPMMM